ncbi:MAG: surface lipoprotein assembly modifier, partial [Pseudomonadota bacterium]
GDIGLSGTLTDYSEASFDDGIVGVHIGARRQGRRRSVGASVSFSHRYYANELYYSSVGLQAVGAIGVASRTALHGSLYVGSFDYKNIDERDGVLTSSSIELAHVFSPTVRGSVWTRLAYEAAGSDVLTNTDYSLGASYGREFHRGITLGVSPSFGYRSFAGEDKSLGGTRTDRRFSSQFSVTNRKWAYKGWAPKASYTYTNNHSSISIYEYTRHVGDLTFTRVF